jgi:hypothetical protein
MPYQVSGVSLLWFAEEALPVVVGSFWRTFWGVPKLRVEYLIFSSEPPVTSWYDLYQVLLQVDWCSEVLPVSSWFATVACARDTSWLLFGLFLCSRFLDICIKLKMNQFQRRTTSGLVVEIVL